MADQAEKLRALIDRARPLARDEDAMFPMIAVSGARAGVGATTVALNLAVVLADRGDRVLLVDVSQHRSDVIETPLVRRNVEKSLGDVLAGKCSAREAIVKGPAGIQMLVNSCDARTAPDFSRRAQQRLLEELQSLGGSIDLIVMDVGPGQSSWTQRLWQRAKLVLLVTTPDDAAVLDAYASLKVGVSDARDTEIRLLVNQADSEAAAVNVQRRIQNSCQRFLSRSVQALPALPRYTRESLGEQAGPRVWEVPNSPFGHAALWLGRAVGESLKAECSVESNEDQACFIQAA